MNVGVNVELSQTKLKDFIPEALSASKLADCVYCPVKFMIRQKLGRYTTEEMAQGIEIHRKVAEDILSRQNLISLGAAKTLTDAINHSRKTLTEALVERRILENPPKGFLFLAIIPNLRLWGKPDRADCTNGRWPIIIEHKTTGRLPLKPWPSDKVQLGVYMLGMETLGFQPEYGCINYILREKESRKPFEVNFNKQLKTLVSSTIETAKQIIDGQWETIPDLPQKCQSCSERSRCEHKLS